MNPKAKMPLHEVADRSSVSVEILVRFIAFEWILPADVENQLFDEEDLARIRLIQQLQEEFGVNNEGISIILHLVDQLNRTHLEVRSSKR